MHHDTLARAVRSFLRKRPRTVLQQNASVRDQNDWFLAKPYWDAGFPVTAPKTCGYGTWRNTRKGA